MIQAMNQYLLPPPEKKQQQQKQHSDNQITISLNNSEVVSKIHQDRNR